MIPPEPVVLCPPPDGGGCVPVVPLWLVVVFAPGGAVPARPRKWSTRRNTSAARTTASRVTADRFNESVAFPERRKTTIEAITNTMNPTRTSVTSHVGGETSCDGPDDGGGERAALTRMLAAPPTASAVITMTRTTQETGRRGGLVIVDRPPAGTRRKRPYTLGAPESPAAGSFGAGERK
jgi:hypothetical protein